MYVPSTTPETLRSLLAELGAEVVVHGHVWVEADQEARRQLSELAPGEGMLLHAVVVGYCKLYLSIYIIHRYILFTYICIYIIHMYSIYILCVYIYIYITCTSLFSDLCCYPGVYVPPFDHPDIWDGHATLVPELVEQLDGVKPAAVVLSVGGGGLFLGVDRCVGHCHSCAVYAIR